VNSNGFVVLYPSKAHPYIEDTQRSFSATWGKKSEVNLVKNSRIKPEILRHRDCLGMVGFLANAQDLSLVLSPPIPIINFSHRLAPVPEVVHVLIDDDEIGKIGAEHLMEMDYQTFLYLDDGSGYSRTRGHSFEEALGEQGNQCQWIDLPGLASPVSPVKKGKILDDTFRGALENPSFPLGVMACNDARAIEFLEFLNRTSPDKVPLTGLVGVDNFYQNTGADHLPPITTILPNRWEQGKRIASVLLELIQSPESYPKGTVITVPGAKILPRESTSPVTSGNPFISRVKRRIHQQISQGEAPKVTHLAREFSTTSRSLLNQFQAVHACSLQAYILNERIKYAAYLLKTTDLAIAEVAQASGFGKHSQLTEHFKRIIGILPSEYRK